MNQVATFHRKIGMSGQAHTQKEIAPLAAAYAGFALSRQPNSLPFVNTSRNFNLIAFDFIGSAAPERHCPGRSLECFLQRDHDIGLDVAATFGCGFTAAKAAEGRASATAAK